MKTFSPSWTERITALLPTRRYEHLYHSYKMCRRNVGWKASVQKYITNAPINVYQTWQRLQAGKYRTSGFFEFDLMERGKKRHIRSVTIGERIVQRCLCDYALVPVLGRTYIYDNGASMANKGYWARKLISSPAVIVLRIWSMP